MFRVQLAPSDSFGNRYTVNCSRCGWTTTGRLSDSSFRHSFKVHRWNFCPIWTKKRRVSDASR